MAPWSYGALYCSFILTLIFLIWSGWTLNSVTECSCFYTFKFSQNSKLKETLYYTYPKILVEASPLDRVWGIGLDKEDQSAWNEATWDGKNLLGFILTEVRDELMCEDDIIKHDDKKVLIQHIVVHIWTRKRNIRSWKSRIFSIVYTLYVSSFKNGAYSGILINCARIFDVWKRFRANAAPWLSSIPQTKTIYAHITGQCSILHVLYSYSYTSPNTDYEVIILCSDS